MYCITSVFIYIVYKHRILLLEVAKMKRKSRDWDLTLELSCHAGCPTVQTTSQDDDILQKSKSIDGCLKYFFRKLFLCQQCKLFSLAFFFLWNLLLYDSYMIYIIRNPILWLGIRLMEAGVCVFFSLKICIIIINCLK
jgi:hypothetical protein